MLSSLESFALITEHAFEKMGMKLVRGDMHRKLEKWQNQLELLGYKLEGIHKNKFIKNTLWHYYVIDSSALSTIIRREEMAI